MSDLALRPTHRLVWWRRTAGGQRVRGGAWLDFTGGACARTAALAVDPAGVEAGLFRFEALDQAGSVTARADADAAAIRDWNPREVPVPRTRGTAAGLPVPRQPRSPWTGR